LPVQSRKGQILPFRFSIEQITVDPLLWLPKRSPAKRFDERGKLDIRISRASIYLCRFRWEVLFSKTGHCARQADPRQCVVT
jgi:hypothetical protein